MCFRLMRESNYLSRRTVHVDTVFEQQLDFVKVAIVI